MKQLHGVDANSGRTLCGRTGLRTMDLSKPWQITCKQCRKQLSPEDQAKRAPLVTRINLMSGQPYQEPEDTPGYLSPASEAYWSM